MTIGTININQDTRKVSKSINHEVHPWRQISDEERGNAEIEANKLVTDWSGLLARNDYTIIETYPEYYSGDWKNAETLSELSWRPRIFGDGRNFEITVPLAAVIFWKDDSDGILIEKYVGCGDIMKLSSADITPEIELTIGNGKYGISPTTEITLIDDAREYLLKLKHGSEAISGEVKINNRRYGASSFTDDNEVYREFVYCLHGGDLIDVITDAFSALKKVAMGV